MQPKEHLNLNEILEEINNIGASDLHLQVSQHPIVRLNGRLIRKEDYPIITDEIIESIVRTLLNDEQQQTLNRIREIDFSFAFGDACRFRGNIFYERNRLSISLRLIENEAKSISDLGLPDIVETFCDFNQGIVIVTGPTSSGKSTSLASMIDKINSERAERIITIEDPIEFVHTQKKSSIVQREIKLDTLSFANALKSVLREDPDIVMVGEMRDLETIQAALTTAETGHLVFATLHTISADQTVSRIIDVFPANQQNQIAAQLANSLRAVLGQRLVPTTGGSLVPACEVLLVNSGAKAIIRENKVHQLRTIIQTGSDVGMVSLEQSLANYVKAGIITFERAAAYAVDVSELERILRNN